MVVRGGRDRLKMYSLFWTFISYKEKLLLNWKGSRGTFHYQDTGKKSIIPRETYKQDPSGGEV